MVDDPWNTVERDVGRTLGAGPGPSMDLEQATCLLVDFHQGGAIDAEELTDPAQAESDLHVHVGAPDVNEAGVELRQQLLEAEPLRE